MILIHLPYRVARKPITQCPIYKRLKWFCILVGYGCCSSIIPGHHRQTRNKPKDPVRAFSNWHLGKCSSSVTLHNLSDVPVSVYDSRETGLHEKRFNCGTGLPTETLASTAQSRRIQPVFVISEWQLAMFRSCLDVYLYLCCASTRGGDKRPDLQRAKR